MLQLQSGKIVELSGPNAGIMATACLKSDRVGSAVNYVDSTGGPVQEIGQLTTTTDGTAIGGGQYTNCFEPHYTQTVYWHSYPVYVCHDKTAKAIEILKSLESDKIIELKSVKRFIEMVEKIAAIL